jgi:Zn-dependent oligopeptidase
MLENWVWNKDIMKRLSKHFTTGESLPIELIDKKIEAKNLNQAIFTLRQLFFGTFDFLLHTASDQKLLDIEDSKDKAYSIGNLRKEIVKDGFKVNT